MKTNVAEQLSGFKQNVRQFRNAGDENVLLAIAAGWFLSMGVRMIYPVMVPYLRDAHGLTLTTAGLLLTVLFVAYALGQLPGGMLADRVGEKRMMVFSMLVSGLTIVLVITATSSVILFAATALFGFGTALYAVARYTILPRLYPEHLGAANGLTAASQDAGQSVLPPIAGVLAATLLWQLGFGFTVPLFVLIAVVLWMVTPDRPPEPEAEDDSQSTREMLRQLLAVLRRPAAVYPMLVMTLGLCIWQAFTAFYPTYLIDIKGLSPTVASILFGLFFTLGILIKPISGSAYDVIGVRQSLLVVASGPLVAFLLLPLVDGVVALVALTAMISMLLGFATVTEPYLLVNLPEEVRGTGFGVVRTVAFLIGSTTPVLFGAAADNGFFDEAFMALAAFAGAMVLIALRMPGRE